jgi:DNA-binding CsgD family transcriptional regulator
MVRCADESFPRGHRAMLDALGPHLGSALRLRRALRRAPTADDATTEAILSPDGRVLDARAPARKSLIDLFEAVKRTERARTRRASEEEKLELWTALVDARWSIVESVERDGKRMLLACRNSPRVAAFRKLTARERCVTEYALLGHPHKYVAYELGISVPNVSTTLKTVMRKLGVRTRAELVMAYGEPLA